MDGIPKIKNPGAPVISIITCTYNSEAHLNQALESIQNQTYKHIEHVINDSYSTDRTLEIIDQYIQQNRNKYPIIFIQSPPKGVANALNVATEEATGDVIHYLHSDDYYYTEDALEKAASYFIREPDLVWLTGNFLVEFKGILITLPFTHLLQISPEKALSCMNIISHENTFMRRVTVQQCGGFNEDKNCVVEYRLWLNMIKEHQPLIVNDTFTVFVIHEGSTSTGSLLKFSKALLRAFNTQRKEKIIPLIGYYEDRNFYRQYKKIIKRVWG